MFTTILDEAVNGWVLTLYSPNNGKEVFIYEHLTDAQDHRIHVELDYQYGRKLEVNKNAFTV